MFIRTERLMLRPVFAEDWRDVLAGIGEQSIVRMLASAPWPYTPDHAREFCSRATSPRDMRFGITLPGCDGAPLIGMVGIGPHGDGVEHELGYWIGRKWQRRGFATEAVRGVLTTARALGRKRIEAGHFLDNPASGQVLRRCGFVETGRIAPTACAGRGGEVIPALRYECELVAPAWDAAA